VFAAYWDGQSWKLLDGEVDPVQKTLSFEINQFSTLSIFVGPALDALLGGHISMQFGSTAARPHIESGKIRALAITGKRRDPSMPNVPIQTVWLAMRLSSMTSVRIQVAFAGTSISASLSTARPCAARSS